MSYSGLKRLKNAAIGHRLAGEFTFKMKHCFFGKAVTVGHNDEQSTVNWKLPVDNL